MDVTLELESAHDARCNPVWRNAFFVFLPQRVFCTPFAYMPIRARLQALVRQADRIAGALFLPYLVWVTVAGMLNRAVWYRNPAGMP